MEKVNVFFWMLRFGLWLETSKRLPSTSATRAVTSSLSWCSWCWLNNQAVRTAVTIWLDWGEGMEGCRLFAFFLHGIRNCDFFRAAYRRIRPNRIVWLLTVWAWASFSLITSTCSTTFARIVLLSCAVECLPSKKLRSVPSFFITFLPMGALVTSYGIEYVIETKQTQLSGGIYIVPLIAKSLSILHVVNRQSFLDVDVIRSLLSTKVFHDFST